MSREILLKEIERKRQSKILKEIAQKFIIAKYGRLGYEQ